MVNYDQFMREHNQCIEYFNSLNVSQKNYSAAFQQVIYHYYDYYGRLFPWRKTKNPYYVFVSEVMLQQTQADRVVEKYCEWIKKFPTVQSLARASFSEVMAYWQGLGYNRRAKFLHLSAQKILHEHGGSVPDSLEELDALPGIGPNTAASISAFAFNEPVIFIETNIRSVYIHFFFKDQQEVADAHILQIITKTCDVQHPRNWYNALMDYGTMLKKKHTNPSRRSKHYTKQSRFKGSNREVRGAILKMLINQPRVSLREMYEYISSDVTKIEYNVKALEKEGLITNNNNRYSLS